MITSLKRIIKSGWSSILRDGGLAFATIFIMVMTIFLITSLFLFKDINQFLISSIREKVDISVFFKEDVAEKDIIGLKEEVSRIPEVKDVEYVSKEMALDDFVKKHESDPVLMESLNELGGNPFLASLNIKAFEANQYESIAGFFEKTDIKNLIEKIDYYQRKSVIDKIFSLASIIKNGGIILSILLAVIAILTTFNTIRLAIYNMREEIRIQRLVGASAWFIRGPFIIQGAISGFIASLLCLFFFSLTCWIVGSRFEIFFPGLNLFKFFINNFWILLLVQVGGGIILGTISSLIAIRRYLRF